MQALTKKDTKAWNWRRMLRRVAARNEGVCDHWYYILSIEIVLFKVIILCDCLCLLLAQAVECVALRTRCSESHMAKVGWAPVCSFIRCLGM
jgi:hypothetical protein